MSSHHFLFIVYPAQGHINPAFQFAKLLITTFSAQVTLCTPLSMHRRITNKPNLPGLSFLPFSDGYDDGFTGTNDSDYSLYASELNRRGSEFVTNLIPSTSLKGEPFTYVVYTPLLYWVAKVARGFHIPTAFMWTQPATVFNIFYFYFHGYSDHINDKTKNHSSSIELPGLPLSLASRDLPTFLLASNSNSLLISFFEKQFNELDLETEPRILVNSFEALEPEAFRAVDKFNMIPIGPLIPSDPTDTSSSGHIFEWLDSKPEMSVVYVSFGSFYVLSKAQMEEIACALLDCGRSFLWVIREKEEELSCREELEQKGKIVKWCSQLEVLSHPSLACFVTHCGWNSTLESLASGVPMVAFPQWLDQKTNAKLIEDVWKIGVRVDHLVNEDGVVKGGEIRKCLEMVMGSEEKAKELRRNAKKWKDLAMEAAKEGGSSEKNLRTFLDVDGSS